ncbi:MAG: hypothetical protein N2595_09185 [bacterium]|nr:hypothetical protein [bacterium]
MASEWARFGCCVRVCGDAPDMVGYDAVPEPGWVAMGCVLALVAGRMK